MSVTVEPGDPRDPAASALLKQSHALMRELFPAEDNFYLDIDALTAPHITFFVAQKEGEILGTAALADKAAYGEVKSMFVAETAANNDLLSFNAPTSVSIDDYLNIWVADSGNHRIVKRSVLGNALPMVAKRPGRPAVRSVQIAPLPSSTQPCSIVTAHSGQR